MASPLVPLDPQDVPPGSVVRYAHGRGFPGHWMAVTEVHGTGVRVGTVTYNWERLMESFEILLPGAVEWVACSKPGE
jgi:hypothetical protein